MLDKGEEGNYEDLSEEEQGGASSDSAPEEAETWMSSSRVKMAATGHTTGTSLHPGKSVLHSKKTLSTEDKRPSKRVQFSMDEENDSTRGKASSFMFVELINVINLLAEEENGGDEVMEGDDDSDIIGGQEEGEEEEEEEESSELEEEESDLGEEEESDLGEEEESDLGEEEGSDGGEMEDSDGSEEGDTEGMDGERGQQGKEGEEPQERDKQLVKGMAECKYVPPHLRQRNRSGQVEKLKKRIQGLVNRQVGVPAFPHVSPWQHIWLRLSESNMQSISSQVEQLYLENSRNGKPR